MKIVVTTSTLPVSDNDKVPAFVKDQAIELKKKYTDTEIIIHAPHNYHSRTARKILGNKYYKEIRFHYFWPFRWELLAGRGIVPALRQNKLLYFQIPFLLLFQLLSLFILVRKEKPDIIYAHWFTPQAITAALVSKLTGIPIVFTTHASDVAVLKGVPFSRKIIRWTCLRATHFTAVSQRTASRLKYFFNDEDWQNNFSQKLHIIPMGVKLTMPKLNKADIKKTVRKYGLPNDKSIVLFLGRLAEIKGIEYLIETFSQLPPKHGNKLHLVIAGDGLIKPDLVKKSEELGLKNITFTGYIHGTDKDVLLELADTICIPSIVDKQGHMEGLPVVMMEGLAAGKIVLASDVSGAESIITSGKDGFIFAQKSIDSLKKATLTAARLSPSEKKAIEIEARKLAQQFSWDTITDKHYQIFKDVYNRQIKPKF